MAFPEPRIGRSTAPRLRLVALAAAAAMLTWFALGLGGAYLYTHRYSVYRGFPPPVAPAGVASGHAQRIWFYSPALHTRTSALVYLPAGYRKQAAHGRRFGALYVLHGHPGRARDILEAGAIGRDLSVLQSRHRARPMLIVLPEITNGPLGGKDTEWADTPAGRYDQVVVDIVHAVDSRFATRADRGARILAGLSSGAYAAINVTLHHLGLFGNFESWSGNFMQTPTGPFRGASPALLAANSPALYVRTVRSRIARLGLRGYLYVGSSDATARVDPLGRFAASLRAAGAEVTTAQYPGGHDWALWRRQMPHMLRVASRWLGSPVTPGRSATATSVRSRRVSRAGRASRSG